MPGLKLTHVSNGAPEANVCFVAASLVYGEIWWVMSLLTSAHRILHLYTLQWRHNERDCVSNYQRFHCLLNYWSRRRSKKTSKLRVTALCTGNSPVNPPHIRPVTRKMFPFDDVIMIWTVDWVNQSSVFMMTSHTSSSTCQGRFSTTRD